MSNKLKSQQELLNIVKGLKEQGKKVVFARGCFDLFHPGHFYYLKKAKALGDFLVVWLNRDQSIKKLKGEERPIFSERHRTELVSALEFVDFVCLFRDEQGLEIVERFKPDLVAVNDCSAPYLQAIKAYGGEARTIPLLPEYSSSKIINQILKKHYAK